MKLGPSFDQAALSLRQCASCHLDWIDAENRCVLLIVSMKMWCMVPGPGFPVHSNNNAEEATQFRHRYILLSLSGQRQRISNFSMVDMFSLDSPLRFWLNA